MEVEHPYAFVESYPQPSLLVLDDIAAAVRQQSEADVAAQSEIEEGVTVIAHQSATVGGYPDRAITVLINVVNIVAGHSQAHDQVADIVLPHIAGSRHRRSEQ